MSIERFRIFHIFDVFESFLSSWILQGGPIRGAHLGNAKNWKSSKSTFFDFFTGNCAKVQKHESQWKVSKNCKKGDSWEFVQNRQINRLSVHEPLNAPKTWKMRLQILWDTSDRVEKIRPIFRTTNVKIQTEFRKIKSWNKIREKSGRCRIKFNRPRVWGFIQSFVCWGNKNYLIFQ